MMSPPPGGLPPWLQVLPPWITLPYTAIQQIIKDFTSGVLPATEAPTDLPKPGFSPLPPGMQEKPGFTPLPLELQHEKPGFTPLPPEMMPTVDRGPQAPPRFPIPGTTPLPPEMQGGGVRAATDDDELNEEVERRFDELNEEYKRFGPEQGDGGSFFEPPGDGPPGGGPPEGLDDDLPDVPSFFYWRDYRTPTAQGFRPNPWSMMDRPLGERRWKKDRLEGFEPINPSEVRHSFHEDTTLDSPKIPGPPFESAWSGTIGDPLEYLTPGTAAHREKEAFDHRDALFERARDLKEKWGVDLRKELVGLETDEYDALLRLEQSEDPNTYVDRFAQDTVTYRQEAINDQWEEAIEQAEIEARNDADDESNEFS